MFTKGEMITVKFGSGNIALKGKFFDFWSFEGSRPFIRLLMPDVTGKNYQHKTVIRMEEINVIEGREKRYTAKQIDSMKGKKVVQWLLDEPGDCAEILLHGDIGYRTGVFLGVKTIEEGMTFECITFLEKTVSGHKLIVTSKSKVLAYGKLKMKKAG